MDGGGNTNNSAVGRDALLYHIGHAYRVMLPGTIGGCFQLLKLGTRENYRALLDAIAHDPAMRHCLWLEALRWAAYFGAGGAGHDFLTWLTEQLFTGRLGLYEVVCSGPARGEPKKPDQKQVRAALSAGLDSMPVVGGAKTALQIVTGTDVVTDEPLSRWGELGGAVLGIVGGKGLLKLARKRQNTPPKKSAPKPMIMPQKKVPCFKADGLPQSKVSEFERQLAGQEKGLNALSAEEYLKGREAFSTARDTKMARQARAIYENDMARDLEKGLKASGMSPRDAAKLAAEQASEKMNTLAALHNPDLIAGGKDVIGDFGDRNVNSSIGSQWKNRVGELDEAVKKIPETDRGKVKVNAKLERCK